MIVAMSRRIAIELYKEIVALRPDWDSEDLMSGKIKVVMTGSSSDPVDWQKFIGTKATREVLAKRMKDKNDELKSVCLMHLSDRTSDENVFQKGVQELIRCPVYVAHKGLEYEL